MVGSLVVGAVGASRASRIRKKKISTIKEDNIFKFGRLEANKKAKGRKAIENRN